MFSLARSHVQHFLLSAAARSLSIGKVMRMSDQAPRMFSRACVGQRPTASGVSGLRLHHLPRLSSRSLSALAMQGVRLRFLGDFGHAVRLA